MEEEPIDIVLCPCIRCKFQTRRRRRIAEDHVRKYGKEDIQKYHDWFDAQVEGLAHVPQPDMMPDIRAASGYHKEARRQAMAYRSIISNQSTTNVEINTQNVVGEQLESEEGIADMLVDFFCDDLPQQGADSLDTESNKRRKRESIIKEACRKKLYEGATVSKIRVVLSILNLQTVYGWSDVSVSALFQLLQKILPEGNCMPDSRLAAKKTLSSLGLDYENIHACPNDHVLFRKELANEERCPHCNTSRYREDVQGNKVPQKVLRHFPLIPRIKHMFRCREIAALMSWHSKNISTDNIMRVPADSPAWKYIDSKWPVFGREPRNLRLGLGTDGVNPFGLRSTKWSTWPVVLVNYNIPPWMTTKKGHLMLSLLIPGKRKVKDMSVYLTPLIDELQELWKGIPVIDKSKKDRRRVFNAKAILMWTMHDYPGYGDISKYSVQGYHACPKCGPELEARYSTNLKKMVYAGHTKFLPMDHPMRGRDRRPIPNSITVNDWKTAWDSSEESYPPGMKGLNAFYALPYWTDLLIQHLLDPMHCFKNIAVAIWQHINGHKDTYNSRADLKECNIMRRYWPMENGQLPVAPWILRKQEKDAVKKIIETIRTPTGTMHCLKGAFTCTTERELSGLKSHDWHKMLQV